MTALEYTLIAGLGVIYLSLLFTMAVVTYRKQHIALFIAGFFLPILWLLGAMMAPRPGSNYRGPL